MYILSDVHFADSDCKLMDPNWITPEEQVEIINSMVGKGDTFVCLGDVGDPKYVPMIKARKKILLLGNHDARGAYKDGCKHINLAANVCGYTPINLGNIIKDGILSDIESIHRVTIDRAVERKLKSSDFN